MNRRYNISFFLLLLVSTYLYSDQITQYHHVKKGENLSSVARRYHTTVTNIKKLNNLKSAAIYPDQRLIVKRSENKEDSGISCGCETVYYVVEKGDSLSRISRKFNVTVSQIKRNNNLKSNIIVAGRRLKIEVPRKLPDIETPQPIMGELSEKVYHRIKKGETLEILAKEYNVTPEQLRDANLLSDGDFKEGQMIVVPPVPVVTEPVVTDNSTTDSDVLQETSMRDALLKESFSYLDMPYKLGGTGNTSVDCSTLTKLVYKKICVPLPNTAFLQFQEGTPVDREEMTEGDLVFFKRRGFVGHVGIYIGNNLFIHASTQERKVTIASLENSYFRRNFAGARRYIPDDESLLARRFGNVVSK